MTWPGAEEPFLRRFRERALFYAGERPLNFVDSSTAQAQMASQLTNANGHTRFKTQVYYVLAKSGVRQNAAHQNATKHVMNKNSNPAQKFYLQGGWGGQCPQLNFFKLLELSERGLARKLILGLQVNMVKANSHMYDVTR